MNAVDLQLPKKSEDNQEVVGEGKISCLINYIINSRKEASNIIKRNLKIFSSIKLRNKNWLVQKIISLRSCAIQKIIWAIKKFSNKAAARNLNVKVKDCFSIYPSINGGKIEMIIYPVITAPSVTNIIPVINCPIRKCLVADIPKENLKRSKMIYFNFKVDDVIVIDPKFVSNLVVNDIHTNSFDYSQFEQKIKILNANYKLKKYIESHKKSLFNFNNQELEEDNLGAGNNDTCDSKGLSPIEINSSKKWRQKNGIDNVFIRRRKNKTQTVNECVPFKSILKQEFWRNSYFVRSNRKVSFGNVQFSF